MRQHIALQDVRCSCFWLTRKCTLSVCLPAGLQLLVGFADKLRLLSVLMDDLKTVKEVGCTAVAELETSLISLCSTS
jgi:hypothetical protein